MPYENKENYICDCYLRNLMRTFKFGIQVQVYKFLNENTGKNMDINSRKCLQNLNYIEKYLYTIFYKSEH